MFYKFIRTWQTKPPQLCYLGKTQFSLYLLPVGYEEVIFYKELTKNAPILLSVSIVRSVSCLEDSLH